MTEAHLVVSIRGASKAIPGGSPLLEEIDLDVARGEAIAIVGRSGSGKSTLLSVLGHLDRFDSGTYSLNGRPVGEMSSRDLDRSRAVEIGFIFQRFALIAHLSVLENVIVPLRHIGGYGERQMRGMALESLARVDMESLSRRAPRKLSGGEQQRVAVARALVHSPQLILADEPTGSLDHDIGASVIALLMERVREMGASLAVVTHDLDVANTMDRVLRVQERTLEPLSSRRKGHR